MGRLPPLQGHTSHERSRNAGCASLVSATDLLAVRGLSATGTLYRGWDVGRLCYLRRGRRAKREEVRWGAEHGWGGMWEQAGQALCLPRWRDSSLVGTGSAQHRNGRSLVPCRHVLDHLSGGAQSVARPPGQLPTWRGLRAVFSPNQLQGRLAHASGTEAGGREPTTASREGAGLRCRDLSGLEAVAVLCSRLGGHSGAGPGKTLHGAQSRSQPSPRSRHPLSCSPRLSLAGQRCRTGLCAALAGDLTFLLHHPRLALRVCWAGPPSFCRNPSGAGVLPPVFVSGPRDFGSPSVTTGVTGGDAARPPGPQGLIRTAPSAASHLPSTQRLGLWPF